MVYKPENKKGWMKKMFVKTIKNVKRNKIGKFVEVLLKMTEIG